MRMLLSAPFGARNPGILYPEHLCGKLTPSHSSGARHGPLPRQGHPQTSSWLAQGRKQTHREAYNHPCGACDHPSPRKPRVDSYRDLALLGHQRVLLGCVRCIPSLHHSVQRVGVLGSAGALYRVPPPDDPTSPKLEIGVARGSSVGGVGVRGRGVAC
jgi:hypothetical protein